MIGATVLGAVVFGVASGFSAVGNAFVAIGLPGDISTPLAAVLILGAGIALGTGLGTPLSVAGEIVLIALDQRRLLAQQGERCAGCGAIWCAAHSPTRSRIAGRNRS